MPAGISYVLLDLDNPKRLVYTIQYRSNHDLRAKKTISESRHLISWLNVTAHVCRAKLHQREGLNTVS